jgi:hypothetical protein
MVPHAVINQLEQIVLAQKDGKVISAVRVRTTVWITTVFMVLVWMDIILSHAIAIQVTMVPDVRQILMTVVGTNVHLVHVWMVMALTHVIAVVQDILETHVIKNVLRHHVKMVCVETYANANWGGRDHIVT